MITLHQKRTDLITLRSNLNSKAVGLVPTMGNLHQGHLDLVKASINDNDITIVTIFVNPKQFAAGEDFEDYPRTLDADIEKLRAFESKEIIVFAPSSKEEIYPDNFSSEIHITGHLNKILCAKSRPTHFDGVATVVYQLLTITNPDIAYFGQKDLQQCHVIRQLIKDFNLNLKMKIVETQRESDGLALSSRNQYLSPTERKEALILNKSIKELSHLVYEDFEMAIKRKDEILEDPKWDYLEIRDNKNHLKEVSEITTEYAIIGAYKLGKTRLLDNQIVRKNVR